MKIPKKFIILKDLDFDDYYYDGLSYWSARRGQVFFLSKSPTKNYLTVFFPNPVLDLPPQGPNSTWRPEEFECKTQNLLTNLSRLVKEEYILILE